MKLTKKIVTYYKFHFKLKGPDALRVRCWSSMPKVLNSRLAGSSADFSVYFSLVSPLTKSDLG
jgi:hypothetical protein